MSYRSKIDINMKLHKNQGPFKYKEKYFNVPVDHFNIMDSNNTTFPMKYLLDE